MFHKSVYTMEYNLEILGASWKQIFGRPHHGYRFPLDHLMEYHHDPVETRHRATGCRAARSKSIACVPALANEQTGYSYPLSIAQEELADVAKNIA